MVAHRGILLVRAASLVPVIRYLERGGVGVERLLRASDLSYFPFDDPERPVASNGVLAFSTRAALAQGLPDLGCHAIEAANIQDLGTLGSIVAGAPTLREALVRVSGWLHFFAAHQKIQLEEGAAGPTLTVAFARSIDPAIIHVAEQYTAMMIQRLCLAYGMSGPVYRRISFRGEPIGSLDLMRGWFCDEITRSSGRSMTLVLQHGALDARPGQSPAPVSAVPASWLPLGPGLGIRDATRYLIEAMLLDAVPGIDDVARVSGLSTRTLQRRLHEEGSSYSELLDEMRRRQALADVLDRNLSLTSLSARLGYSSQGSFTRAFRRWAADNPRSYRRRSH